MIKKITNTIYLLKKDGKRNYHNTLSYLLVDQDDVVLIEPGNLSDFDDIYSDIKSIIDPKRINYMLLSHPDPDLTSSLPLFYDRLGQFKVITEWRTQNVLASYGLNLSFYLIKENHFGLRLKSGRQLIFMMTPFAHYAGAFMTYDQKSKILFSGDLFGAIHHSTKFYADEDYLEPMSIFHENYMPSSDFIRPIMKQLMDLDIQLIAPQHGALIHQEMIEKVILYLYNLDFYNTYKTYQDTNATHHEIDFVPRLVQIIIRLRQMFPDHDIMNVFKDTKINLSFDPIKIETDLKSYPLWHRFFEIIYAKKGDAWLNAIETLVTRLARVYQIDEPQIYQLRVRELQEKNREISKKMDDLQSSMKEMYESVSESKDQLLRCPITDLYRKDMLRKYLKDHMSQVINQGFLINLDIDQIIKINQDISNQTGDDTILMMKYLLSNELNDNELLFRGNGSSFLLFIQNEDEKRAFKRVEDIRNFVSKSEQFVMPLSISLGMVKLIDEENIHPDQLIGEWFSLVESRLKMAKMHANGTIIYNDQLEEVYYKNNLLLVDEEQVNINLITQYMEHAGYRVYHAINPIEAMKVIESHRIDLIISEINLSKLDGFALKKSINEQTKYANIPFIFLSHMKNESLIERANRLNVMYFLKKPFYMVELLGLVKRSIR